MTEERVVKFAGKEFIVRPPELDDAYDEFFVEITGEQPITGPCAPNIDAYQAMLAARVKAGLITPEVRDKILEELRENQKRRLEDLVEAAPGTAEDGDSKAAEAAKELAEKAVNTINTFARDDTGALGLQSYALRACTRECLAESDTFMKNRGAGLRERFRMQLGVTPLFVRILRNGQPLYVPDRIDARPCHVQVKDQKFHSIKQREVLDAPWTVEFAVRIGKMSALTPEMVKEAFALLPTIKLGADRSQESGGCRLTGWGEPKGQAEEREKRPKPLRKKREAA